MKDLSLRAGSTNKRTLHSVGVPVHWDADFQGRTFLGRGGLIGFAGQAAGVFFTLPGVQKNKIHQRQPSADEQHVREHRTVRPGPPREIERCDLLIAEHHHLQNAVVVGEHVRYVATCPGQWLALATWSAAAWHLKPREAFLGWAEEQRRLRLPLLAHPDWSGRFCPNATFPS